MKHINEFGQIESEELRELLAKVEQLLEPIMQSVTAIEATCIAKHVASGASFLASREAMRKSFEKQLDDALGND